MDLAGVLPDECAALVLRTARRGPGELHDVLGAARTLAAEDDEVSALLVVVPHLVYALWDLDDVPLAQELQAYLDEKDVVVSGHP